MSEQSLAVVVPCFNERATIEAIVERVLASPYTAEVIIVDDGSTDGTREVLQKLARDPRVQVYEQPFNQGKGAALRRGFREVRAPYAIVQDADLEYDPNDYGVMIEPLLDGRADVVFGSRDGFRALWCIVKYSGSARCLLLHRAAGESGRKVVAPRADGVVEREVEHTLDDETIPTGRSEQRRGDARLGVAPVHLAEPI